MVLVYYFLLVTVTRTYLLLFYGMEAIKAYLDELDTDFNTVDTVVKTSNAMADALLNSQLSLAQSKFITVQCDAHIPVKLKISELDLCCMIGNLFDNAIEASQKLPEDQRLIRVYMDMKGTQLYISFANFIASKKRAKAGKVVKTSKGDGNGFGLVRIDAIIERLDVGKYNKSMKSEFSANAELIIR